MTPGYSQSSPPTRLALFRLTFRHSHPIVYIDSLQAGVSPAEAFQLFTSFGGQVHENHFATNAAGQGDGGGVAGRGGDVGDHRCPTEATDDGRLAVGGDV